MSTATKIRDTLLTCFPWVSDVEVYEDFSRTLPGEVNIVVVIGKEAPRACRGLLNAAVDQVVAAGVRAIIHLNHEQPTKPKRRIRAEVKPGRFPRRY